MNLQDQITAALATAAATIVTALSAWVVAWVQRKVRENETANRQISAQSLANGGSMARLDSKMDGLHDVINGGQLPTIIEIAVSNSDAMKTLTTIVQRTSDAVAELVDAARRNRADIDAQKAVCLANRETCCVPAKPAQPVSTEGVTP